MISEMLTRIKSLDRHRLRVVVTHWPANEDAPTVTVKRGLIDSRSAARWIERQRPNPDTVYDIEIDMGDEDE